MPGGTTRCPPRHPPVPHPGFGPRATRHYSASVDWSKPAPNPRGRTPAPPAVPESRARSRSGHVQPGGRSRAQPLRSIVGTATPGSIDWSSPRPSRQGPHAHRCYLNSATLSRATHSYERANRAAHSGIVVRQPSEVAATHTFEIAEVCADPSGTRTTVAERVDSARSGHPWMPKRTMASSLGHGMLNVDLKTKKSGFEQRDAG